MDFVERTAIWLEETLGCDKMFRDYTVTIKDLWPLPMSDSWDRPSARQVFVKAAQRSQSEHTDGQ